MSSKQETYSNEEENPNPMGPTEITLKLLNAIHQDGELTQRKAAKQLGIALGMVNAYFKRCVKKGLVKASQIPPNRYAYYLTPKGFQEKSALTASFLSQSLLLFRLARTQYQEIFQACAEQGRERIMFYGMSDLTDVAQLLAKDHPLTLAGIIDPQADDGEINGTTIFPSPPAPLEADALIITCLKDPQGAFERAAELIAPDRVYTPKLLNITRDAPALEDEEATP